MPDITPPQGRLDPNVLSATQWHGLDEADLVDHAPSVGPFWTVEEVAAATGIPVSRARALFEVRPLAWPDKPLGSVHHVAAVPGQYRAGGVGDRPTEVEASDLEEAVGPDGVKVALHGQLHPVLVDANGTEQTLVPGLVDVWFTTTDPVEISTVLADHGLAAVHRTDNLGHVIARLDPGPTHGDVLREVLDVLWQLDDDPLVRFAEPVRHDPGPDDTPAIAATIDDFESAERDWPLAATNVTAAQAHTTGSADVPIVLVDSGLWTEHPDLGDTLLQGWDQLDLHYALDAAPAWSSPDERQVAHGTKVAGVVAGLAAVAPDCPILPFKISGSAGGPGNPGYALRAEAIVAAVAAVTGRPAVMNVSWRTSGEVIAIREALRTAADADIVICCSAGNADPVVGTNADAVHYPSGHAWLEPRNEAMLSVGALSASGGRASYSYFGANSVSVMAPGGEAGGAGSSIFTTSTPERYTFTYGTSFASPHVAGVAALVRSAAPHLTAAEVVGLLRGTAAALDHVDPVHAGQLGSGRVDALKAVQAALGLAGGADGGGGGTGEDPEPVNDPDIPPDSIHARVNLNTATAAELDALPGVTWSDAQRVVDHRSWWGRFHAVDDLLLTGAFLPSEVAALQELVTV